MAFNEGKHQLIDLLGAMQVGSQNRQNDSGSKMRDRLLAEQLKGIQEQNKMSELRRSLLTPTGMPNATGEGHYADFAKAQEAERMAILMNGGIPPTGGGGIPSGGGFGGRGEYGSGGGGSVEPQPVEQGANGKVDVQSGGLGYYGPDRSKMDSASIATGLGKLYGGGGSAKPQEQTLYEKLVEEEANTKGLENLISQGEAKGKIAESDVGKITAGSTPVRNQAVTDFSKKADQMANDKPLPSEKESAAKEKELKQYQQKIYSSPQWKSITRAGLNDTVLAELPEAVRQNDEAGLVLDVEAFLKSFRKK
jgi:hypothetical protein